MPALALLALSAGVGISDPALAVTVDDCRAEVENLHGVLPSGITGDWLDTVQGYIDHVNSIDDAASLQKSVEAVWAESDAYDRDPDPDGDGMALSEEVFTALSILQNCFHRARNAELSREEDETADAADEKMESEEPEVDLASPPTAIESSQPWFTGADFPQSALRDGRQGQVNYDLTIGADGKVLGCQSSGPPGSADLEAATCDAVFARARFKPATDSAGRPTVGEVSGVIRWTIP